MTWSSDVCSSDLKQNTCFIDFKKIRCDMAISYNGLWKILIDKGMNKGDLKACTGLSSGTIAKMTNGEAVTLTVIEKICRKLNCNIGDIVEIVPQDLER